MLVYSTIAKIVVDYENHKDDQGMKDSIILKTMGFTYVSNFFTLFIFTFREKDFNLISRTITSSMLTSAFLNVLMVLFSSNLSLISSH